MIDDLFSTYENDLKKQLQEEIENIKKSFGFILKNFEKSICNLIQNKFQQLKAFQNNLSEDFEEVLNTLRCQFQDGLIGLKNELNLCASQTVDSNTFDSNFDETIKNIQKNRQQFDLYSFKYYNCIHPDQIQPKNDTVSQIYVLNKHLTALLYHNQHSITLVDHNKHEIYKTIKTPYIIRIISSNATATTLCYQTDRDIFFINYITSKVVRMFVLSNTVDEMICACQLDKHTFAYATNFGRIWIVNVMNGETITKLDGEIPSVLLKFNNKYLISAGISKGLYLWNWRKKTVEQRFIGHNTRINSVIKFDNDHIVSSDQSGKIYMFKISTCTRCKQFIGHERSVLKVLKLNQDFIASCSFDKTIRFWNVSQEICFRILDLHQNFVLDIAKFGKNKMISTCQDKFIYIWG
ncbi:hypothetical protein ABPG72_020171 [Tetrahymena utriculariae]